MSLLIQSLKWGTRFKSEKILNFLCLAVKTNEEVMQRVNVFFSINRFAPPLRRVGYRFMFITSWASFFAWLFYTCQVEEKKPYWRVESYWKRNDSCTHFSLVDGWVVQFILPAEFQRVMSTFSYRVFSGESSNIILSKRLWKNGRYVSCSSSFAFRQVSTILNRGHDFTFSF